MRLQIRPVALAQKQLRTVQADNWAALPQEAAGFAVASHRMAAALRLHLKIPHFFYPDPETGVHGFVSIQPYIWRQATPGNAQQW